MSKQRVNKQERVVEAVRRGLEGAAAVEFIHQSGFAIAPQGIARHLRTLGGRGKVQELIDGGLSNLDILRACLPEGELDDVPAPPKPSQSEMFVDLSASSHTDMVEHDHPLYETVKLNVRLPADLYEAIRLAARAEQTTQNDLIVDILTSALSRMPDFFAGKNETPELR